jgi:sulfite exporter TauE/SafE
MCGGFVISYTAKDASVGRKSHLSHIYYGAGKTLSYTVIGAAFGLIGSIIAFTPMMRGIAGILAGVFLLLFGLRMLNVFPWLRKFAIRTPSFISRRLGGSKSPLITGLLNGLMIACGPLQAIYIMAAGTGSWFEGAKLLFIFALGTLPVMLGFAYFASFVTSRVTHTILRASGALVIIMGLIMINNGLALTGTGYDVNSLVVSADSPKVLPASADNGVQEIHMDVLASGWSPDKFVLEKGVPVKWIINGKEITSCNNAIVVPKLGLEFDVKPGIQVIEFTPTETGTIPFSCWMGMIHGQFIVVDNAKDDATVKAAFELAAEQAPAKSSGCGCGMHK